MSRPRTLGDRLGNVIGFLIFPGLMWAILLGTRQEWGWVPWAIAGGVTVLRILVWLVKGR